MNNIKLNLKRITRLTFRQVIYLLGGAFLLGVAIVNRDWVAGVLSLLFLYQGIFNSCLFGSCTVPKR